MQDHNEKKIGMSHDGYLKLYQLSRPVLKGYDCLLIDEAQDLTPGMYKSGIIREGDVGEVISQSCLTSLFFKLREK